jgi:hypothetical protein
MSNPKPVFAASGGRYDRDLKRHVSWWKHDDEHFPKTKFPAGSTTKKGKRIDLQTGEVRDVAEAVVGYLLGECDPKELEKGTKDEEEEHDMSPKMARKTALQHLTRVDPKYYTKTEKVLKSKPKADIMPGGGVGGPVGDNTAIGVGGGGGR